jgi:hypothetical protein
MGQNLEGYAALWLSVLRMGNGYKPDDPLRIGPHAHERKRNAYGAGGFCAACQGRIMHRMRNRYRKAMQGRNLPAELATFKDALCLRYNAAQRLFSRRSAGRFFCKYP